jgi:xanthine dehydrogenase molybdenum-binding subunit
MTVIRQLYPSDKGQKVEGYTVYTNMPSAGAMRAYGTPQAVFAIESHMEDIVRKLNIDRLSSAK